MHDNLVRVESAVSATSSGNLTWDRWTLDYAVALGLAGQRNPLGFALVRYLSESPSSVNVWNVVLHLATALERREGISGIEAKDAAWQALDVWNNRRCPSCGGRGVMNVEQALCRACNGTGERDIGALPEVIKAGVAALNEAESWMEGQLARMMKDSSYKAESGEMPIRTHTPFPHGHGCDGQYFSRAHIPKDQ